MFVQHGLQNESDVEQKFIYQLLTHSQGLEYDATEISTKSRIRKLTIDKGASLKSGYFPDYVVSIDAVPVLVIEAKGPGVVLDEAYREARLYANELNSQFPTDINPVTVVMAANDVALWVGNVDSSEPQEFRVEDISLQNESLTLLRKVCSRMALASKSVEMRRKIWPVQKYKPLRFGSPASQSEELEPNQFARQLIPLIKKFFDPDASRTRIEILQKAYVSTEQVTHYNEILEALLGDNLGNKKFKSFEEVETTKNDAKAFNRALKDALARGERTDSLLLLIGGVGSGKSIFIDRYFYFLMDDELRTHTLWAYVDFNDASENLSDLRKWIRKRVLEDLQERNSMDDLHSMENLQRYFNRDISRFRSSQGSTLYDVDRVEYERRLATKLDDWVSDPEVYLKSMLSYLTTDGNKKVVVVFDNADKRDRDQQLRVFQEVQAFRSDHKVFSVLSLRDETYDRHKSEPPLDTYLAPFTFRITPPRFLDVVKRRLELLIEDLSVGLTKHLEFRVSAGAVVRYPSSDLGNFLISFYQSLFHPKREIRLVLEALAGRNVRVALQMFSDILMSGHLSGDKVLVARVSGGAMHLPEKVVIRTLMRTKYRYYSDSHGYVSNIFGQIEGHLQGSPFGFVIILGKLADGRKRRGELGIEGYRLVSELLSEVLPQGLGTEEGLALLQYLLERNLVQADHQRTDSVSLTDHVKITASGYFHLKFLPTRFEYVTAIAMDTWYRSESSARRVYDLTHHNFGYDSRAGKDKVARVSVLVDELNHERDVWRSTSVVDASSQIEDAVQAVQGAITHFKSNGEKQLQKRPRRQ